MESTPEIILNILQILVLIPVILRAFSLVAKNESPAFAALYTLAMVSLALEDVYWITYDLLRPGTWMPFAADEVAGSAVILLLASAADALLTEKERSSIRIHELVYAVLFMAANMILWYAWSGEWFQDIVFGLPYIYLMLRLLQGTRSSRVPGRGWSLVFLIVSTAVIVLHFCVLLVPPEAGKLPDLGNNALMFGLCASLFVLSLRALLQKREGTVFLTFFTFFWSRIVIYMSSAAFYCLALFFNILSIPLMLVSVKDQVRGSAETSREVI